MNWQLYLTTMVTVITLRDFNQFLHIAPEKFIAREIITGAKDGKVIVVKAGLKEGDRVVTIGSYQLKSSVQ